MSAAGRFNDLVPKNSPTCNATYEAPKSNQLNPQYTKASTSPTMSVTIPVKILIACIVLIISIIIISIKSAFQIADAHRLYPPVK